jgi:hypothetical protein
VTQTAQGATAFYDIDTPVTLAKLDRGDYEYLSQNSLRATMLTSRSVAADTAKT